MRWIPFAIMTALLLAAGATMIETDAADEYGTVWFYIGDELITSTDTDYCEQVAERIDTHRDGYTFLGWTDDPSTNRIVDISDLPPWDVVLYAVYVPVSEPAPDLTGYLVAVAVFLFLLTLGVIYSTKLS